MRFYGIRSRMLMAALLPVTLVALLLSTVFLAGRYRDLDEAHNQRARLLARELAIASEYGLFAGNVASLQSLANGILREREVRAVRILDEHAQLLATAGAPASAPLPALGTDEVRWLDAQQGNDVLVQPVRLTQLALDDLYQDRVANETGAKLLGHVVLEISRVEMISRANLVLLIGLGVTVAGLLLGGVLAVRLGRGVVRPILRVGDVIGRLSVGEFSARVNILPGDPLRDLQQSLNQMAEHLEQGRVALELRVAQATAELRAKKEEAETATLAKSRFLAAASHDLRQPIHALGMFVARLAQLPHDRETGHLIDNLEASVRAMQDLLDALLDVSRLEAGAVLAQVHGFALATVFEQLQDAMGPVASDKGLALRVRHSKIWVHSDPVLLHRILLNLVSNALRYTRRGGALLGCRRSRGGSHVWIEVWDTGVGIDPAYQQDIFREFYQVGNPERDRSKGLGLGLNIVDRTARLLGHNLEVRSTPGRGTRFRLELPLAEPSSLPHEPAHEGLVPDDVRGLRVLVIEDDQQSAHALQSLLASWGCVAAVVDGLQGALALLDEGFEPELILSDFRLRAGETGLETLRILRNSFLYPPPACLLSGDTNPELIQTCRDAGVPLLHKPVRPAKLRTLMRRLIRPAQSQP